MTESVGDWPMLTLALAGWVVMTGLSHRMVTVAVLLSVGPHVFVARTQKLFVEVSTGVISIDGKLKYSSDPRMAAAACSSVRASRALTSAAAPLRRRNRA